MGTVPDSSLAEAEDAVARLDERIATSPIAEGFRARTNFLDACAALYREGELVHLEDLALHDAAADVRTPSHALTRAHRILRARRRIAAAPPGWALSENGLATLRGQRPSDKQAEPDVLEQEEQSLDAELAAIDALIARTSRVLAGPPTPTHETASRDALSDKTSSNDAPSEDREQSRTVEPDNWVARWHAVLDETSSSSPILAAAIAGEALDESAPFANQAWLGPLVVADLLRARKKTRHHLASLHLGLKLFARERGGRLAPGRQRWVGAMISSATQNLADHDRWLTARHLLERKLVGRRSTSSLPALVELVMRVPMVSANVIAFELKISSRAAQQLVAELGLREMTGRGRYRCWGVL